MSKSLLYGIGICIFIGSFCGGCREKISEKGGLDRIRLVDQKTNLKQSDFLEVVGLIHLETQDSCLVGYISQLIKRASGFYVWSVGQVVKFDSKGRFLYRINQKGRGPSEYSNIGAISVDGKERYLYIYDDRTQKMLCYDAQSGKYVRHVILGYSAFTFTVMPDSRHFLFYCGFSPSEELQRGRLFPRFIVADSLGKIEKTFVYCDKNVKIPSFWGAKDVFSVLDSSVYCFANYNDTIFHLNQNLEVTPAFVLDYGNENQKKNDVLVDKLSHLKKVEGSPEGMGEEEIVSLSRMVRTDRHILFVGDKGDQNAFWLYDRKKREGVDLMKVEDDLIIPYYFMAADADYFYFWSDVSYLKQMIVDEPQKCDREMVEMVEKLDEDANPVIFKVRVKNM